MTCHPTHVARLPIYGNSRCKWMGVEDITNEYTYARLHIVCKANGHQVGLSFFFSISHTTWYYLFNACRVVVVVVLLVEQCMIRVLVYCFCSLRQPGGGREIYMSRKRIRVNSMMKLTRAASSHRYT